MRKANYDKFPSTKISGTIVQGWEAIVSLLKEKLGGRRVLAVDLYTGVHEEEVLEAFSKGVTGKIINVRDVMTDDVLYGYVTNLSMEDYFDADKLVAVKKEISEAAETVVVIGTGAALVAPEDAMVVYIDMARWEIDRKSVV